MTPRGDGTYSPSKSAKALGGTMRARSSSKNGRRNVSGTGFFNATNYSSTSQKGGFNQTMQAATNE